MTWTKIEVYNGCEYLGSFYTGEEIKNKITAEIDEKYGRGCWTKYNIGN